MQKLKSTLIFLLKIVLSLGILAFLVWQAWEQKDAAGNRVLTALWERPMDWAWLGGGFAFTFLAVLLTILRWRALIATLGLKIRLTDNLRFGYVGYLFNLAPAGIVSGDALKTWLLARRYKDHPEVGSLLIAAAVMDRMIGLYALFMMAGLAVLGTGVLSNPEITPVMKTISIGVLVAWGVGTVAGLAVLLPPQKAKDGKDGENTEDKKASALGILRRITRYCRMYRNYPGQLVGFLVWSLVVHTCFALSVVMISFGVWGQGAGQSPSVREMLFISPASMSTSAIPLPVGPYEAVLDLMYKDVTGIAGQGLVVALAYRVMCLMIASLGLVFYFTDRREIQETMTEKS